MFDNEIAINQFQLIQYGKIVADLPEAALFEPAPGHGHPAAWVLGHLAITGEYGQSILGGKVAHPEWLPLFGPGSSDRVAPDPSLTKDRFHQAIVAAYAELQRLARAGDRTSLGQPHGFAPFEGTPLKTKEHMVAVLLTNHFAFHLSQLSSCRRSAGHKAIF